MQRIKDTLYTINCIERNRDFRQNTFFFTMVCLQYLGKIHNLSVIVMLDDIPCNACCHSWALPFIIY